jgi:hypothetical protein
LFRADGHNDSFVVLPLHEQSDQTLESRYAVAGKDREGIAAAGLAAPKMKAIRHFGWGGESAGIAGKGANHYRMHENKTRTLLRIVNGGC